MTPNSDDMLQHLLHLFGDQQQGRVELAWRCARRGTLCEAQSYDLGCLEDLVMVACSHNEIEGQNVYIGAALRKPDSAPFGRATDADFYAAPANWCDLDEPGACARVRELCGNTPATLAVMTGRKPHPRAQLYWKREEPITNADTLRCVNSNIAAKLGSDPSVVNPSRVLRLAGSIAWPTKPGREIEMTQLMTFDDRPASYVEGEIEKQFPQAHTDSATQTPISLFLKQSSPPERWIEMLRGGAGEGARNQTMTAFAGHLLRHDINADVAEQILHLANAGCCKPPLDAGEVQTLFDSVCRLELTRRGAA